MSPLRIGVIVDGEPTPSWQAQLVGAIACEPGIVLALVLIDGSSAPVERGSTLFKLFQSLDGKLHRGYLAALAPATLAPSFLRLAVHSRWVLGNRQFSPDELSEIARHDLDILLQLGSSSVARTDRPLLSVARSGVWSLRFGDARDARDGIPCFWEQFEDAPTVTVSLHAERGDEPTRALCEARLAMHDYSLARSRAPTLGSAVSITLRALRLFRDRGWEWLANNSSIVDSTESGATSPPGNAAMVPFLFRYGFRIGRKVVQWLAFDIYHWTVAIARRGDGRGAAESLRSAAFRPVEQPSDRFYADPILIEHAGKTWLFLEIFPYARGRGVIGAAPLYEDGSPGPFQTVLEREYHLSYPFIFHWRNRLYMIPESTERRTIELYRCDRFPDRWTLERVLFEDIVAADSTVVEWGAHLWLFTGIVPPGGDLELHVFSAEEPTGVWKPHPLNPVVSDVMRARPGGQLFVEGGKLIRPAQDSTVRYGRALSFNWVRTLTREAYEEEEIAHVGPEELPWRRDAIGTHTFNAGKRFMAADACVLRFRGARWLRRLLMARRDDPSCS